MSVRGLTFKRIPNESPCSGAAVAYLHYLADETMTPERIAFLKRMYTRESDWRKEMEIDFGAHEGELMFPEYNPVHVDCTPFDVSDPSEWTIWMACDPHMRTPHGFAWEAFSPDGDRVVCGELWPSRQFSVREYSEAIQWLESDSEHKSAPFSWSNGKKLRISRRIMDTHGSAANSDEGVDFFATYRRYDLTFQSARKGHDILASARDIIGEAMLPRKIIIGDDEKYLPLRRIFKTCIETRAEYANVRYPAGEVERKGQEQPKTYQRHLIDALNYIQTARPGHVRPTYPGDEGAWSPLYPSTAY